MNDFQKSLTRFMYVALVVVAAIGAWALIQARASGADKAAAAKLQFRDPYRCGVTATGTCVVRTRPDLVEVTIGVRQSARTARGANNYVKSRIPKIIRVLTKGGVELKDIQTEYYNLEPRWVVRNGKQFLNWSAVESLRVRIRKVDSAAALIDEAVKAGANQVGRLEYTVKNVNDLRAKGRAKASKVARAKAGQLAASLGGNLGGLISCSENYPGDYGYWDGYGRSISRAPQANIQMNEAGTADSEREELTIQPGELVMNVVVTATYELE